MKNKSFIVVILFVILCCLIGLLFFVKSENMSLKNKYNEIQERAKQNEIDRENYVSKKKELEELKLKNKDKILKYEEVKKWNQEIEGYLD